MAAMPLFCITQGTVCLWLQGENLPQNKSALPTAPSPLPEGSGFGCWLRASGAAGAASRLHGVGISPLSASPPWPAELSQG